MNSAMAMQRALMLRALVAGRLRACAWSLLGTSVGPKTRIGPRCINLRPICVTIGARVELEPDVYLKVVSDGAELKIGDYTFVGRGVEFDVMEKVHVGSHTLIAPNCFITDHTHLIAAGARIDQQACEARPTTIGSDVWLGTGSVVLSGITIGDGAVIGANSVVTRDIAAGTVMAGAPARHLRLRYATPSHQR